MRVKLKATSKETHRLRITPAHAGKTLDMATENNRK